MLLGVCNSIPTSIAGMESTILFWLVPFLRAGGQSASSR
jgi:hypothetical protein